MMCPACGQAMAEQTVEGHLGASVTIDTCVACRAFWFDDHESLQLSPGGTLKLFALIGEHVGRATPFPATCKCPRCALRLVPTHDMQRTTRFQYLRCPVRHGRFTSFLDFLREKDFIRPLSAEQLARLRENVQMVHCSNCGAPVDLAKGSTCPHCGSPLSMLDMQQAQRLVSELQQADQGARTVDPALPLRLEQARREVEASFDAFDRHPAWHDDVQTTGLVEAGVRAVSRWLKG
jgi:hypothetical protein